MRKEVIGNATLYCGDCMDVLPTLGKVDAVVTDPPYGIGMDGGNVGYKGFNDLEKLGWDNATPEKETFDAILALNIPTIIFGGNYFPLPLSRCWLIWDKGEGFYNRTYAEAELAWTNIDKNTKILKHDPLAKRDYVNKKHPTQKPAAVMQWCIGFIPGNPIIIADTYMGSGTTGVAALKLGRHFIGIEKEPKYFDIACKRIEQSVYEMSLFA